MDAILLVGGFGTRLLPLTKTRPKPLIPLANIPFVERTIHWLRDAGVDHVILSLHYNAEQFMSYFSRLALDIDLSFAVEGRPLGTGGAIKNCEPFLRSSRCLICNGDIFTTLQLPRMMEAHEKSAADVTIALTKVEDPSRFGVIETYPNGAVHTFTEKPPRELARSNDINAGIYIFERRIFDWFSQEPCSVERDIFPVLLHNNVPIFGYTDAHYWSDLGTPGDYMQAHRDILANRVKTPMRGREVSPGIWLGEHVQIADDAVLRAPVLIGDGATIASGAIIGPSAILGQQTHIEKKALVADSILWEGATVRANSVLRDSIIGQGSEVDGLIQQAICGDHHRLQGRKSKLFSRQPVMKLNPV